MDSSEFSGTPNRSQFPKFCFENSLVSAQANCHLVIESLGWTHDLVFKFGP